MSFESSDNPASPRGEDAQDASIRASVMLGQLVGGGLPAQVSLGWLTAHLQERSFGAMMLILSVTSMLPFVSIPAGLLLLPLAVQLMMDRPSLRLPRGIAARPFPSPRIATGLRRAIAVIRHLETFIRPRWQGVFRVQRFIGLVVLFLALSLLIPIPFSNFVPALAITLIALAYLEKDGLLLSLSLFAALVALAIAVAAIWGLVAAF
jgi:hypothetical protein